MRKLFILTILCLLPVFAYSQGLKSFTLRNGLKVYIWEDSSQSDVYGMVSVRAGSVNDPLEFTGLAHYLEHLMFKGTERIGALDWGKEQVIYKSIIEKYDNRSQETDPNIRKEIDKEINLLSVEQAKLSQQGEFNSLVESIGGSGLNAGTSLDYTVYFNRFPKIQLEKWLELYSVRFMNPVFRSFQSELETVYEEFNMYQDNRSMQVRNYVMDQAFPGHPYSRPIIGLGEHLKNPQISKLIEFYDSWYVPENMSLILVGDIKTDEVAAVVNRKFGRISGKAVPQRENISLKTIKGRTQLSTSMGQFPQVVLIYNGVPTGHKDEIALEVALEMLSNRNRTGLLDKLSLDGDIMSAYAGGNFLNAGGRIIINAVPTFDYSQRRFESHRGVEKMLTDQFQKLAIGDVDEWLLETVKNNMIRSYLRTLESSSGKANVLSNAFINGYEMDWVLSYNDLIGSITKDDVMRVVNAYLNNNFIAIHMNEGKYDKVQKIEKPSLPEVPDFPMGDKSIYFEWFTKIPVGEIRFTPKSFDDVFIKPINEKSRLFYTRNSENDIFTMTIKYGIGKREIPHLGMSIDLMNSAGVMAAYESQEFRYALNKLNARVSYSSDEDYTIVNVEGTEQELTGICNLITRQILMPKLDAKQLNSVKGRQINSYRIEKDGIDVQEDALREYILYRTRSSYIDRMTNSQIINFSISDLVGAFQKASDYAAEIHYVGSLSFDDVFSILSANLPLKAQEQASNSPQVKPLEKYNSNIVYFLPNIEASQSRIIFFTPGGVYSNDLSSRLYAFNQYFSGGFGGLVMNEIREKNSMAYTTYGRFQSPPIKGEQFYFNGYIGTQADKTVDAIGLFMELVNNMPVNDEKMDELRSFIRQVLLSEQPNFRSESQYYEVLKRMGYSEPPANIIVPEIDKMTFDDIVSFYTTYLKGKPMAIGIIGNPKMIDLKALERFGKVERLNVSRLFKE